MSSHIVYNGRGITRLSPSGMYEVYLYSKGRFWKFDDLDDAKAAIDEETTQPPNRPQ